MRPVTSITDTSKLIHPQSEDFEDISTCYDEFHRATDTSSFMNTWFNKETWFRTEPWRDGSRFPTPASTSTNTANLSIARSLVEEYEKYLKERDSQRIFQQKYLTSIGKIEEEKEERIRLNFLSKMPVIRPGDVVKIDSATFVPDIPTAAPTPKVKPKPPASPQMELF